MLRAARLESRIGFHLDPRSEELIAEGLPLLKRVSGDRIRHELEQIFHEPEPERALCRLDELGVLAQIHSGLRCDRWLCKKYQTLREHLDAGHWMLDTSYWKLDADATPFLYLALLAYRLDDEGLEELITRLKVRRDDAEELRLLPNLKSALPQLGKARWPSAVYLLLQPYPARVLAVAWVATNRKRLRERLLRYQTEWRLVEPEISGDDLKGMELRPGPLFGRLLGALRDARLDGKVGTREEEMALLERLLAAEDEKGAG